YPTPPPPGSVDLPRAQPLAITSWMRKPRLPRLTPPRRRPRWFAIACAMFACAAAIGGLAGFAPRSAAQTPPPPAPAPVRLWPPAPAPTPAPTKPTCDEALQQLRRGKTCADRRVAIARLAELGDARAVPAIRKARHRTRGNACLVADADDALRKLE